MLVVLMDEEGVILPDHHPVLLEFEGRSVLDLRDAVATLLGVLSQDIIMCVRGGLRGRLIPLTVTLLPTILEPMHLFILQTGTPAALALRYPDVGAE
ncbi:hypothetical protein BS78_10G052000 [Paspalum vaginatum]|uniref:DUF569 domain-containing protein n=1 Tax=Paspalum vaginatum TaxID=158149 RepID=A0A9W7X6W1_9POAL|nr:hypothetical protein BS78_K091400 [Paspalum vaginatum]KAJ1258143.1 hypothetical protein BS78_10G052000 [Paspalum vaginatum]